jgi:hypothetical protein
MNTIAKHSILILIAVIGLASAAAMAEESDNSPLQPPQDLAKDQFESCQANLCLGETGKDQGECQIPLKKLKDMKPKKRPQFLALCPK